MPSQLALPSPHGSLPREGCDSPGTRGHSGGRWLTGPWERLIHGGWKELQHKAELRQLIHPASARLAATVPSPCTAGPTQLHHSPHGPPPAGAQQTLCWQLQLAWGLQRPDIEHQHTPRAWGTGALGTQTTHSPLYVPSVP